MVLQYVGTIKTGSAGTIRGKRLTGSGGKVYNDFVAGEEITPRVMLS